MTDVVSLLFTATLYQSLATGATLAQAHKAAVWMFAEGGYRTLDEGHPVGALLKQVGVDWPAVLRDLEDEASDLAHPFYWGVFKLSGLVNEPVAILG